MRSSFLDGARAKVAREGDLLESVRECLWQALRVENGVGHYKAKTSNDAKAPLCDGSLISFRCPVVVIQFLADHTLRLKDALKQERGDCIPSRYQSSHGIWRRPDSASVTVKKKYKFVDSAPVIRPNRFHTRPGRVEKRSGGHITLLLIL